MAHCNGLVLGRKRLSHKDRLFNVFVGDFFMAAMLASCQFSIKTPAPLVNLPLPKLGTGACRRPWQGPDIKNSRNPNFQRHITAPVPKLLTRVANQQI
jgi:hypothetical protein